jgi:serine/threonine protein kinase
VVLIYNSSTLKRKDAVSVYVRAADIMSVFQSLNLKNLAERQIGVMRAPTNTRPIIRLVEEDGVRGVVKDFSVNGFAYRNTIGRFLLWRESTVYERLRGIKGIPMLYRKVDGLALVFSHIEGENLEHLSAGEKPDVQFFERLAGLIRECHDRGVAHCDLKRAANVMIDEQGRPYIIDWAAAITAKEFCIYPFTLIYKRFMKDDFNAVTKLKMRYCPDSISDEEKRAYMHRGTGERAIRAARDFARKWLQKIA